MDSRRRSLERAALSTGSPDDEARVLLERLRAEPPCKECGGRGRTYVEDRDAARDALTRPTTADGMRPTIDAINAVLFVTPKPCSRCAGTGSLLRARVEIAAWAGHAAARLVVVLGEAPDAWVTWRSADEATLSIWLAGLSRWGVEAQVAAALGAARACYEHLVDPTNREVIPWVTVGTLAARALIEAGEAWLACPCAKHGDEWSLLFSPEVDYWVPVSTMAIESAPGRRPGAPSDMARRGPLSAASVIGEPAVREAAAAAVRRWALGRALDGEAP